MSRFSPSGNRLWYHAAEIQTNGSVVWSASAFQYDKGVAPSVAIAGSTIVEVHQAGTTEGPLRYHAAEIRANGSVVWATDGFKYDNGLAPSVSASGPTVIEVHQAGTGVGSLWHRTAGLQSSGSVKFGASSFQYDEGEAPRVAAAEPTIPGGARLNQRGRKTLLSHRSVLAASCSRKGRLDACPSYSFSRLSV
jgi:hypothetical protein